MEIKELKNRPDIDQNEKLYASYALFDELLMKLRTKELPDKTVKSINDGVDQINSVSESEEELRKQIKKTQSNIIKQIEKEHKLVTKNHYRNTWLAVGMAAFGIPIGVAFGASLGSMAFLAIGIPIGMVIGLAIGSGMDKKAFEEGRQIDLELKY
jgi:F0F1-type ATP synthase assembly protein I